jgi:hypothetical protein
MNTPQSMRDSEKDGSAVELTAARCNPTKQGTDGAEVRISVIAMEPECMGLSVLGLLPDPNINSECFDYRCSSAIGTTEQEQGRRTLAGNEIDRSTGQSNDLFHPEHAQEGEEIA